MNANAVRECELVARAVAMWGSLAAAIVFGIGFLTDRALSYHLVTSEAAQIGLILLMFAGYMLAWRTRFEVAGSAHRFGCRGSLLDLVPDASLWHSGANLPGRGAAGPCFIYRPSRFTAWSARWSDSIARRCMGPTTARRTRLVEVAPPRSERSAGPRPPRSSPLAVCPQPPGNL